MNTYTSFAYNRSNNTFFIGIRLVMVSTLLHPSREDPSNHMLVFAEYTSSDSWISVHIGQFIGAMIVFIGGFSALYQLPVNSEDSTVSLMTLLGYSAAILTASVFVFLQAVDGIALKMDVDSRVAASADEKGGYIELQKVLGGLSMEPTVYFAFQRGQLQ